MAPRPDPVDTQLAAYNAQDLAAFCDCFHDDVIVEDGYGNCLSQGLRPFRANYEALFLRYPLNHARLLARMRIGPWVIDEEEVSGRGGEPFHVVVQYRLHEGRIASVRFLDEND
jgi:hypothetical protein